MIDYFYNFIENEPTQQYYKQTYQISNLGQKGVLLENSFLEDTQEGFIT